MPRRGRRGPASEEISVRAIERGIILFERLALLAKCERCKRSFSRYDRKYGREKQSTGDKASRAVRLERSPSGEISEAFEWHRIPVGLVPRPIRSFCYGRSWSRESSEKSPKRRDLSVPSVTEILNAESTEFSVTSVLEALVTEITEFLRAGVSGDGLAGDEVHKAVASGKGQVTSGG